MIKKILAINILCISTIAQANCTIDITYNKTIGNALSNVRWDGWSNSNYQEMCEKIRKNNAKLYIFGTAQVLSGSAIAHVNIRLGDKNSPLSTIAYTSRLSINHTPSMDIAYRDLIDNISLAFETYDIDAAIKELNEYRKEIKKNRKN